MTAYVVTVTRLYQSRPDGSEKKYFRGAVVDDFTDEDAARHLASGSIAKATSGVAKDAQEEAELAAATAAAEAATLAAANAAALAADAALVEQIERGAEGGDTDGSDGPPPRPDAEANKPELIAWIFENVTKADGSDYTKTELRKMNPDELRGIIDSVE